MAWREQSKLKFDLQSFSVSFPDVNTYVHFLQEIGEQLKPEVAETNLISYLYTHASLVVESMIAHNLSEQRRSCVIGIGRYGDKPFLDFERLGDPIQTIDDKKENTHEKLKVVKYLLYALGKLAFLVQNPQAIFSKENKELYFGDNGNPFPGGAVILPNTRLILTCSGFSTAEQDSAVCIAAMVRSGLLSVENGDDLAQTENNLFYIQHKGQLLDTTKDYLTMSDRVAIHISQELVNANHDPFSAMANEHRTQTARENTGEIYDTRNYNLLSMIRYALAYSKSSAL